MASTRRTAPGPRRRAAAGQPAGQPMALFDLDRTLLPGSSLELLGRALAREGLVSRRRLARGLAQQVWFTRRGSSDAGVDRLRREGLVLVAGLDAEPLVALARRVGADLAASVRPEMALRVRRHREAGHFCAVVSASPQPLVEALAGALGLHRAIGTCGAVADGRFTGGLDGAFCYGTGKVERLRVALGDVDLTRAWAYADSASDLPLLEACGHPVAVGPDRALRRIARSRSWPVVDVA